MAATPRDRIESTHSDVEENRMKKTTCMLLIASVVVAMAAVIGCGKTGDKVPESVAEEKAEVKTEKVDVGDIEVAYRSHGEGYPLVLIMGYSGTMDLWDPDMLNALAAGHRVITFDNRGMGETTAGTREFTVEQFADDTAGLMDALGINRAQVLGQESRHGQ
jgi:alpha-beta hydrolase superfamily lysophospholipase